MPRKDGGLALRAEVLQRPERRVTAVIASARNYKAEPIKKASGKADTVSAEQWQSAAWAFYDTVPEFHYAANWVGNLLSRAVLTLLENGAESTNAAALELLDGFFGGRDGQAEMLRQLGLHFTVAGEAFIIGEAQGGDLPDRWRVTASTEISVDSNLQWKADGDLLDKNALVIRMWRPHPQKPKLADSPARAALPVLAEIDGMTKHIAAQVDSRLTSAGVFFVPEEMAFGSVKNATKPDASPEHPEGTDDDADAQEALSKPDELVRELIDTAAAAITDPTSPAARVPIIIQAPGEFIDKAKLVTFWSELDDKAKDLREEAIRRLALGLDMPPEALTGTADMNHWNAWQMDEAGIKSHTEPLLNVITGIMTTGYLRPALAGGGQDSQPTTPTVDTYAFAVGVDTTALRVRPNRSKESQELNQLGALKTEVMLRENGFDPKNDLMDDAERQRFLLWKIALGSPTPGMVLAAAQALGVQGLENVADAAGPAEDTSGDGKTTNPSGENRTPNNDGGEQGPPETPNDGKPRNNDVKESAATQRDSGAILVAGGLLVQRALERAGNRIKSQARASVPGVPAAELYLTVRPDFNRVTLDQLLEDAWGNVPRTADELGLDPVWFTSALDDYTRGLLHSGTAHDRALLAGHIARHARLAA